MPVQITISSSFQNLARELSQNLNQSNPETPFTAPGIFLPSAPLKNWLKMEIARNNKIAANLKFQYLEDGIAKLLNTQVLSLQEIQITLFSLLKKHAGSTKLAKFSKILLSDSNFDDYKAWLLTVKLASLFQEYENHRPEMIEAWDNEQSFLEKDKAMEEAQEFLYRESKAFFDVPRLFVPQIPSLKIEKIPNSGPLHFFAYSQISKAYTEILFYLGTIYDVFIYHCNYPLFYEITEDGSKLNMSSENASATMEQWGVAKRSSLEMLLELSENSPAPVNWRSVETGESKKCFLASFQNHLKTNAPLKIEAPDESLQIAACPGRLREVETALNHIINSLKTKPELNLTQIGIITPNLNDYLPAIKTAFEKYDFTERLPYNLSGRNAFRESVYAAGVRSIFQLMDTSQSRNEVFELIFNDCFLTRKKISRDEAQDWLKWADDLNLFHAEGSNGIFDWQWGAKRLRLGHILNPEESQSFEDFLPYSDINTANPKLASEFCILAEDLAALKEMPSTAPLRDWAERLIEVFEKFLEIPEGAEEESKVFFNIRDQLEILKAHPLQETVSLNWVRSYLEGGLEDLSWKQGLALRKGISIGALDQMKGIPFEKLYILGMNGGEFPGTEERSMLNLRWQTKQKNLGDISRPELNRSLFTEALFSTKELILSYNAKNLEKDEEKYPSSLILELFSTMNSRLKGSSEVFDEVKIPVSRYNPMLLDINSFTSADPRVKETILAALNSEAIKQLDGADFFKEWLSKKRQSLWQKLENGPAKRPEVLSVELSELKGFLEHPLRARLQRELGLYEEGLEDLSLKETEPFGTDGLYAHQIMKEAVELIIQKLLKNSNNKDSIDKQTEQILISLYEEDQLSGKSPLHAYGLIDKKHYSEELKNRITKLSDLLLNPETPPEPILLPEISLNEWHKLGIEEIRIGGKLNEAWNNEADKTLNAFVFVKSSAKSQGRGKNKVFYPTRHLLAPYLFFRLASLSEKNQWKKAEFFVSYQNALVHFSMAARPEEDREYIKNLIKAFLNLQDTEDASEKRMKTLPLDLITKTFSTEELKTLAPELNWRARLAEKLEEEMENEGSYTYGDLDSLSDAIIPENAYEIIQSRLADFLNWTGEEL